MIHHTNLCTCRFLYWAFRRDMDFHTFVCRRCGGTIREDQIQAINDAWTNTLFGPDAKDTLGGWHVRVGELMATRQDKLETVRRLLGEILNESTDAEINELEAMLTDAAACVRIGYEPGKLPSVEERRAQGEKIFAEMAEIFIASVLPKSTRGGSHD